MVCELKEGVGFYRPRQPQQTPFYQLVERFYPAFERVYEERYQERRFLAAHHREERREVSGLRGPAGGLCPCAVPEMSARILRRVFLSRALFLSQLPPETGFADGALVESRDLRGGAASPVCFHDSQTAADLLPV